MAQITYIIFTTLEKKEETESNGCTRGGVNCASKINAQIKQHKSYTGSVFLTYVQFSTTQAEFHYPQVLQRVHLEPLQPQVLNGITCNLTTTSFTQGSLATFLTSSPLQPARVQPLQIKDFSN